MKIAVFGAISYIAAVTSAVHLQQDAKCEHAICEEELLPNPEDKLDEVAALQRGVEVPSFREDKHYYDLIVPNKVKMNFKKEVKTSLHINLSFLYMKSSFQSTSWRVKSTNPLYSQDGSGPTENISDQTLLKRHEKFEKEEKQRKRYIVSLGYYS